MTRILVTNNGPHPAEKWAMATAQAIFDTSALVSGDHSIAAQKFQLSIAEALQPHHQQLQTDEQTKLVADADYINSPLAADDYADKVMADVVSLSKGSPWEVHFANGDVQREAKKVIANHFMTSQHVERLWHADRNPKNKAAQTYKANWNAGV